MSPIRAGIHVLAVFSIACAAWISPRAAAAGELSPRLAASLGSRSALHSASRTDATDAARYSVIVHLRAQANLADLEPSLAAAPSLAVRHDTVVGLLHAAQTMQMPLIATLDAERARDPLLDYTSYWITNCIVVRASADVILRLATRDDVEWIESNFQPSLRVHPPVPDALQAEVERAGGERAGVVPPGVIAVGAQRVWHEFGITGRGRVVATLDTGVEVDHRALRRSWRGSQPGISITSAWLDLRERPSESPIDDLGYGTRVMGVIVGLDGATSDTIGVAPGARWISAAPSLQLHGIETDNDILTAYQWLLDPDGNPNTAEDRPDVVQNSWGVAPEDGYEPCDSRWWRAIDNAEAAGIVTLWPAGDEGPDDLSIVAPAGRSTTATQNFSIAAIDAVNFDFPYPAPEYSSRGPTICEAPMEAGMKPEVVAPGSFILTSQRGGGLGTSWSSTYLASAHVAGVVALIREANPDLDSESIKRLLLETARGIAPGLEDEIYGRGLVDAHAAVEKALYGFASVEGRVRNASDGNTPVAGAAIEARPLGRLFHSGPDGHFRAALPPGRHTLSVSHPLLGESALEVELTLRQSKMQDLFLHDVVVPKIREIDPPFESIPLTDGAALRFAIDEGSRIAAAELFVRADGGDVRTVLASELNGSWVAVLPRLREGSELEYWFRARDAAGNESLLPIDGHDDPRRVWVTHSEWSFDGAVDPLDWTLGLPDDDARSGAWVLERPSGTRSDDRIIQPDADHGGDGRCFVTGNPGPNAQPGDGDVDDGCTTLVTPSFDLAQAELAFVSYWSWFVSAGAVSDDLLEVEVSNDGGASWLPFDALSDIGSEWRFSKRRINNVARLTRGMRLRFRVCDRGRPGLVEAALDDLLIETWRRERPGPPAEPSDVEIVTALAQNRPNPFGGARAHTTIVFRSSASGAARLDIYDAGGRLVQSLPAGVLEAGAHELEWDGRDAAGRPVTAGCYTYRLRVNGHEEARRLTVLR